ncbi:MAG: glycosyltransferase [Promethearchaeota archaeon]|nr:MAG: glycosyltransferase [Candidatus Lokiarchaeota archaeon]
MIGNKKTVWVFTFEYAGIAKVGGLGEVPSNQAKSLVKDFDLTVFIPSHGQLERLKKSYEVSRLDFNCVGQLDLSPLGLNEPVSSYEISFYKLNLNGVNIVLLCGENTFTRKYLDDKSVYNLDTFTGKLCLYSIGMRSFIEYQIDNKKDLPNIIHMHDFHVVIPFIGIKQELIKNGLEVSSIITFHLLTWPRYNLDFYHACGIDDTPIKILMEDGFKLMSITEIFTLCKEEGNYQPPTVEKIGAVVSDLVTTVSQSYLRSDIIPNLGQNLIEFKSNFIWDGCDWEYNEISQRVSNTLGAEMHQVLNIPNESPITRKDMKKYLLRYKIGHLRESPLINSSKIINAIDKIAYGNPYIKNGNVKPFSEIGPLLIATGRISHQKGFETILDSIPKIARVIPDAKILLLLLPTEYSLNELETYSKYVNIYPDNLRIIFGLAAEIFYLAHIAADVYAVLSRWEPFGINALEAMSSKIPIIATKVGGLQETVIDFREDSENGTGMLIEKDNTSQFADALVSFFLLAQISENVKNGKSIYDPEIMYLVNEIPDQILKSQILIEPNCYDKIKENCYNQVNNNFRWSIVSKKLKDLYNRL